VTHLGIRPLAFGIAAALSVATSVAAQWPPVMADGVIYGLSSKKKGQLVAVDAASGALKWAGEGRAADHASILLTPAHVLVLTTGGELVLVKRSAVKYEEERRYTVADGATWAVPVVMKDALIVRDATGVLKLTAQ
jgi:outer membrane protein assembly factor BamB